MGIWIGLLLAMVAWGKKEPVNACISGNGNTACFLEDVVYNRIQNAIYFTITNPADETLAPCQVQFFLMREDGKGGFIRTGIASTYSRTPVKPHDHFLLSARPETGNWHYVKDVDMTCGGETLTFHLTRPVFTDWVAEQRLKKKLGY